MVNLLLVILVILFRRFSTVMSGGLERIYSPPPSATYPQLLSHLYSINDRIKSDGISAPSSRSFPNTIKLYEAIGKPLDRIPTIHVGGTNGKVSNSIDKYCS